MNAEVAAGQHIGMVGGHGDFLRGCLRSPGGRGIVVMQSTARGGTVSRIVAGLPGGIVTTARSDADIVVTEYGIAELRGRSVAERARQLIAIAHPDFRRTLGDAAAAGLM
jgi:acyl-CoA hydrolase